jgi:predicted site-specific integrase-resolvase
MFGVKLMPVKLSDKEYYRTHEAIEKIGISRSTFFRWIREKRVEDAKHKDHRGWRLFTEKEIKNIKKFNETITINK